MAVRTYGVTYQDVLRYLPFDAPTVGALTDPVSYTDVTDFVEQGASMVTGLLSSQGFAVDSLGDDMEKLVHTAILKYALYTTLSVLGDYGPAFTTARDDWQGFFQRYSNSPQSAPDTVARAASNIDTSSSKTAVEFGRLDYEF